MGIGGSAARFIRGYFTALKNLLWLRFWDEAAVASMGAAVGAVEEVARIVAQIRQRWPKVRILLRADSGFAQDELMAWCEANEVHFLFGLAQNKRLNAEVARELEQAEAKSRRTGKPARLFKDFMWTTVRRSSWNRWRRVVGKAEFTNGEANPALSSPRWRVPSANQILTMKRHAEADGQPDKQ